MSIAEPVPVPFTPRHALGLPAGSVRALLTLIIVGLVCALMLVPPRDEKPIPIPPYLIYLLFLSLAHYFAAHGNSIARKGEGHSPLYLPGGVIRLLIVVGLGATVGWKLYHDPKGLADQFKSSVEYLQEQPFLPLIVLGGFLAGVVVRWILGRQRSYWVQDIQAWFSLIAVLLLCVAVLIHLVINPSLPQPLELPNWDSILTAVVAFYFGERS